MSYLTCPSCRFTVSETAARSPFQDCPRCLLREQTAVHDAVRPGPAAALRPRPPTTSQRIARGEARLRRTGSRRGFGLKPRPTFAHGPAVDHHHVGREVVGAADQRRADAVGVDGHAVGLEARGCARRRSRRETTIRTRAKPGVVERVAHRVHELGRDAARRRPAPKRRPSSVSEPPTCPAAPPTARSPSARATASDVPTESLSKSTSTVTFISPRVAVGELASRRARCRRRRPRSARAGRCRRRARPTTTPARRWTRRSSRRRAPPSRRPSARASGRGGRGSR